MEVTFKLLKELGFKCPRCKNTEIRSCDLGDTPFASHDHYVCLKCGLRWMPPHWKDDPTFDKTITEQHIKSEFIWILCRRKGLKLVKD